MNEALLSIPLPEFVTTAGELAAGDAHERAGTMEGPPPADHIMVTALGKFVYADAERGTTLHVLPGQQFYMHESRIERNVARKLVHVPTALTLDWWQHPGRILAAEPCDAVPLLSAPRDGSLKIVAGTGYDPGAAAFRLHTAINETTQHTSAFVRWGNTNPHCDLRQLDGALDAHLIRQAVIEADVIHHHIAPFLTNNVGIQPRRHQLVIRHYHGSVPNGSLLEPVWDRAQGYLLLGARLSLVAEATAAGMLMRWSPIPMPVARYRALRDAMRADADWVPLDGPASATRPLRIAHSPTNTRVKGSDHLRQVVFDLRKRGVPVQVDFIRGVPLAESLRRKALADVCFDSFWLGIQGSGLEAGAMELPVIAGDPDAMALYDDMLGARPYTYANDATELAAVIERMAMDADYREAEAQNTAAYVERYHDYAAVARRYECTLSDVLGRDVTTPEYSRMQSFDESTVVFKPSAVGKSTDSLLGLPIVPSEELASLDVGEVQLSSVVIQNSEVANSAISQPEISGDLHGSSPEVSPAENDGRAAETPKTEEPPKRQRKGDTNGPR